MSQRRLWLIVVDVKRLGVGAPSVVFRMSVFFDLSPSYDDGPVQAEVNVGRFQVAKAFVIAVVIVALNEGADAGLEVT